MAQQYTKEEVREMFLRKVNAIVEYWNNLTGTPEKEKLNGVAFSILATIDGCNVDLPGFILAPCPAPEDQEYLKTCDENWFPENHESKVQCDIAGGLHELLHKYK